MVRARILIVEDTLLISRLIEEVCQMLGVEVVGKAGTLKDALVLAREARFDFAVLDINLHDELVFPVADVLIERGLPFFFSSGYSARSMLPERFAAYEFLAKPYEVEALESMMKRVLERVVAPSAVSTERR